MLRLSASGLGCVRGSRTIFDDINLELSSGEVLALVGPNGSGKSSLLRLVAGLLRESAGRIELGGGAPDQTIGEQAHYLGHLDALKPSLTVAENLAFWVHYLRGHGANLSAALADLGLGSPAELPAAYLPAGAPAPRGPGATLAAALADLGLGSLADLPADSRSAGQRRRLSLARLVA